MVYAKAEVTNCLREYNEKKKAKGNENPQAMLNHGLTLHLDQPTVIKRFIESHEGLSSPL